MRNANGRTDAGATMAFPASLESNERLVIGSKRMAAAHAHSNDNCHILLTIIITPSHSDLGYF